MISSDSVEDCFGRMVGAELQSGFISGRGVVICFSFGEFYSIAGGKEGELSVGGAGKPKS